MDTPVLVAVVGLVGAFVGSAVGGLISYFSTKAVRRMEWKQEMAQKDIQAREDLYADFLSEAGRLMLVSFTKEAKSTPSTEFSKLVTLEAKVWFHSEPLGKQARELAKIVMKEFEPKSVDKTVDETETKKDEVTFAALRDKFISDCKLDLQRIRQLA
ncbi:MAG TPA: hypothetical protein VIM35_00055 [Gallionella sp.]